MNAFSTLNPLRLLDATSELYTGVLYCITILLITWSGGYNYLLAEKAIQGDAKDISMMMNADLLKPRP